MRYNVSVIIPVYKVEAYLAECVDSVLNQDYRDFEVILVDDGSPDRCGDICDGYAARDSRVTVIHQENGGLSEARNAGVRMASGEYVVFLDSDDFWDDPTALGRIAARAYRTGADILNYSFAKYREDTGVQESYFGHVPEMPPMNQYADQLRYLTENGLYIACAWNKMIRRSLLSDLPFAKGVYCEDIEWCLKLLLRAKSVDYVPECFIRYRQRSGSITHNVNSKLCADLTEAILSCIDISRNTSGPIQKSMLRYTAFQFGTFLLNQAMADVPQPECIRRLSPHASILHHHGNNKKLIILNAGCRILGLKQLCRLIRLGYRSTHR